MNNYLKTVWNLVFIFVNILCFLKAFYVFRQTFEAFGQTFDAFRHAFDTFGQAFYDFWTRNDRYACIQIVSDFVMKKM